MTYSTDLAIWQLKNLSSMTPSSEKDNTNMLETQKYVRKPFFVDAVQVTAENLADVAEWCGGDVRTAGQAQYIKVRVVRPLNERQTKAMIGDWVLYAGTGFKVYTPKAFSGAFEQDSVGTTMQTLPSETSFEFAQETLQVPGSVDPEPAEGLQARPPQLAGQDLQAEGLVAPAQTLGEAAAERPKPGPRVRAKKD